MENLDGSIISSPNERPVQARVIALKKAKEPFCFFTRLHLKELTGLKARNLRQLSDILREAPDSVIYYHTHRFIEEHHYLIPEPPNDFAIWARDALVDEVLGERLASIDTFEFPTLESLKEKILGVIEECPASKRDQQDVPEGREFHFTKSVSIILPLPYAARDLKGFVEVLREVSTGCLYFHIFESRLRLGKGENDFSIWMRDKLGEAELAEKISHLDPYNYTLEGLRSLLIQLIEKRIK